MKRLVCATLLATASALSLLIVPTVGSAEPTTYVFTGVVTAVSGFTGVWVGLPVEGSYTIDYDNANPAQSYGSVGSTPPS